MKAVLLMKRLEQLRRERPRAAGVGRSRQPPGAASVLQLTSEPVVGSIYKDTPELDGFGP
jgi:hypothetical protein